MTPEQNARQQIATVSQSPGALKEFLYRRQIALKGSYNDITARLVGFLDWMESVPPIARLLKQMRKVGDGKRLLDEAIEQGRHSYRYDKPGVNARSIEDIACVGLAILDSARDGQDVYSIGISTGTYPSRGRGTNQAYSEAVLSRFVLPFLDYVEQRLPADETARRTIERGLSPPAIIHDSLRKFHAAHRKLGAQCFVMMRFGDTAAHARIERAIKMTLKKHGLIGLLARDCEFHEDLYPNILTYAHGCDFGIAVFERLKTDEFNPNVALEVGYMFGLRKHVLLLKDQTLRALHTDLVGKLYKEFDPQHPERTIPGQIDRWLTDKGLA
jgi:hypothetical protein